MNIDKLIRYSVVLSNTGEKICGGYRKDRMISQMLNDEELKMVHFYAGQRWDTRKNLTHKMGKTRYAMAEYENLKRMTFPIDERHLLMVTVDVDADHQRIINMVLDLIKN
jgi:hypothetical protein